MIEDEPQAKEFIKPFLGSEEFINGIKRWCLWLTDVSPNTLSRLPHTLSRVKAVREYRLKSTRAATQKLASYPQLFGEVRQPKSNYLLIPGVSSENRRYIPIGYLSQNIIASDLVRTIPNANLYHFGVLTSAMHMAWVETVSGRLESRYRYSNSIVYNNYPWPENPIEKQILAIEKAAQKVLDVRKQYQEDKVIGVERLSPPTEEQAKSGHWEGEEKEIIQKGASLADLYDPITMPPDLVKAHQELDKAVDLAYRSQAFTSEAKRMEYLFELYEKYTSNLFTTEKVKKRKKTPIDIEL